MIIGCILVKKFWGNFDFKVIVFGWVMGGKGFWKGMLKCIGLGVGKVVFF